MDTTYNGWSNFSTWNVALYIQNDYTMYELARKFCSSFEQFRSKADYLYGWVATPDGVKLNDPAIDIEELDEMIQEL